jgi:DNA-binding response OmpR family regulator
MALQPRVLVIDDDPLFRNLIAGLLKNFYAVTTAESGSHGFHLAMDRPPHVALIDVNMPGWNGLQTLQKFREHPQLSATKTAMLTGDASRETVVTAIRGGADEYIVKTNFRKEELLRKLHSLIAKSSLPIEEEWPQAEDSRSPSSKSPGEANPVVLNVNEGDPRLQEMIDDWE